MISWLIQARRAATAWVVAGMTLAATFALASPPFAASAADGDQTTWSVAPADESGPDGRRTFAFDIAPGESLTDYLAVTNGSEDRVIFQIQAADGYTTQNGRYSILPNPAESVDAGTWIEIQSQVELDPGEQAVVPFTISVPPDATPGDHPAGLAAVVTSTPAAGGGAGVGLSSRFAVAVMTRVTGELTAAVTIDHATAGYRLSWNPAEPGILTAKFDLTNTGNTRLTVTGTATAGSSVTTWPSEGQTIRLLPGESRSVSLEVRRVWPLFRATATITANPVVVESADGSAIEASSVSVKVAALALPLPHLLIVMVLGLIVAAMVISRRHNRRRLDQAVTAAAAEARAQAIAELRAADQTPADAQTGTETEVRAKPEARAKAEARGETEAGNGPDR